MRLTRTLTRTVSATVGLLMLSALAVLGQQHETIGFPMVNEGKAYFVDFGPNYVELVGRVTEREASLEDVTFVLELPRDCRTYFRGYAAPDQRPETVPLDSGRQVAYRFPCRASEQFVLTGVIIPHGTRPDARIRWWLEVDGQKEAAQSYEIEFVKIPESQMPRRMITGLFAAGLGMRTADEVLEAAARFVRHCGMNLVWDYDRSRVPTWRKYGIKVAIEEVGYAGVGNFPKGDSSVAPALYADGTQKDTCPTYVLEHPEETLAQALGLARGMASTHDVITWDWEYTAGMMGRAAPDWCFCERCLKAFEEWSGVSVEGMTPKQIMDRYHAEWRAWYNHLYTERMRILYQEAHASDPHVKIGWLPGNGVTTDPNDPDTRMCQQVLWHTNDDGTPQYLVYCPWLQSGGERYFDIFMPMWYYYGLDSPRYLLEQVEAVNKTLPVEFAVTLVGQGDLYERSMVECDPGLTRAQLLACAVGGAGAGYYPVNWGARHWAAVAKACREIAETEDILLDGTRDPSLCHIAPLDTRFIEAGGKRLASPPSARHLLTRVLEHNGQRLLAVFNFDLDRPAFYRAAFPGLKGDWAIYDVSGQRIVGASHRRPHFTAQELAAGVLLTTPADWGVSLYRLVPRDQAPEAPVLSQGEIESRYRRSVTVVPLEGKRLAKGHGCQVGLVQTPDGPRTNLQNGKQTIRAQANQVGRGHHLERGPLQRSVLGADTGTLPRRLKECL